MQRQTWTSRFKSGILVAMRLQVADKVCERPREIIGSSKGRREEEARGPSALAIRPMVMSTDVDTAGDRFLQPRCA